MIKLAERSEMLACCRGWVISRGLEEDPAWIMALSELEEAAKGPLSMWDSARRDWYELRDAFLHRKGTQE